MSYHPPNPSGITNKHTQKGGVLRSFFLLAIVVGMVVFTFYAYGLNKTIVQKFENRRWDIPARVYSRPLILGQDSQVSQNDLETWLAMLNYQKSDNQTVGTYQASKNTYTIATRGFSYGDNDIDAPQVIEIKFSNQRISSLKSTMPNQAGFVRLEPIHIGGIYPDSNEDRILIKLENTPQALIDALIATEDRNFFEHHGISARGTARALLNNFRGGSMQGGSTLTQQLVKNFYLNSERKLKRKINEAIMALLLERHYSKNDILQAYLNEINLGQNGNRSVNGFAIAAQFYFNRPLTELRLDQYALLVGIAKGPTFYNPRKHPERAKERRNVVLHNMLITGKITQTDYDNAIQQALDVVDTPNIAKSRFPDFLDYVQRELNARYRPEDLKNAGLNIITTLDPLAQTAAETAVTKKLATLQKSNRHAKHLQSALVSADPETGEIVALIGSGRDFTVDDCENISDDELIGSGRDFTGFNRAIDAKRQVGSLLKPVIYFMALQSGQYNLASGVNDNEQTYQLAGNTWTPKNYGGRSHGTVPLTTALANSYNQAAVSLGMEFGIDTFNQHLKILGIDDTLPNYPSILLGAVDLSPIQMLGVYQIFASGGIYHRLYVIDSVSDEKGRLLQKSQLKEERRLPADSAYLTNFALQKVISEGTAKAAQSLGNNLNLAGKTGTTNDARDAWFAGYSGNYVSVVWVGRDDNKPIGLTGGNGALPIWIDYMKRLKLKPVNLPQPDNIEWAWLENGTGYATEENCENAVHLPIMPQSLPEGKSHCLEARLETQRQAELMETFADETASLEEVTNDLQGTDIYENHQDSVPVEEEIHDNLP